jgi:hypothetical protein
MAFRMASNSRKSTLSCDRGSSIEEKAIRANSVRLLEDEWPEKPRQRRQTERLMFQNVSHRSQGAVQELSQSVYQRAKSAPEPEISVTVPVIFSMRPLNFCLMYATIIPIILTRITENRAEPGPVALVSRRFLLTVPTFARGFYAISTIEKQAARIRFFEQHESWLHEFFAFELGKAFLREAGGGAAN